MQNYENPTKRRMQMNRKKYNVLQRDEILYIIKVTIIKV